MRKQTLAPCLSRERVPLTPLMARVHFREFCLRSLLNCSQSRNSKEEEARMVKDLFKSIH